MRIANAGADWTAEDRAIVAAMKADGCSAKQIARKLNRSERSVYAMQRRIGIFNDYDKRKVVDIFAPLPIPDDVEVAAETEKAQALCLGFLELVAAHHPRRAGEIVVGPNGFAAIGGTAEKPKFVPAAICQNVPESAPVIPAATLVPTSSCALAW